MSGDPKPTAPGTTAPGTSPRPCPTCGRSDATHLSMREAVGVGRPASGLCRLCLRTDLARQSG